MTGRIFISHAKEDRIKALRLYSSLKEASFAPWIDEFDLLPGERWEIVIPQIIAESEIFIACLSSSALQKRGYIQKEYRIAYEEALKIPEQQVYIIPLLFDNCVKHIPYKLREYTYSKYIDDIDEIAFLEKLQAYRDKKTGNTTPLSPTDSIEKFKSLFNEMETQELQAFFRHKLKKDRKNPAFILLSCIATLKGVDLTSGGILSKKINQMDEWLSKLTETNELDGTVLYTWAMLKHDYFERRFRNSPPSSKKIISQLKQCYNRPDSFLVSQLRPSRLFTIKTQIHLS